MFTDRGLCGYIVNAMKFPTCKSTNLEELFHNRAEQISMHVVFRESQCTVSKGHTGPSRERTRIVVQAATRRERELNGRRMQTIDLTEEVHHK